jgi:hypothetical protein
MIDSGPGEDPPGDQVEGLVPADPLPVPVGTAVLALERVELALGAVDPLREAIGLPAEVALCELVIGMALELHHPAVLHVGDDPAAVRAVERARGVDRPFHLSRGDHSRLPPVKLGESA